MFRSLIVTLLAATTSLVSAMAQTPGNIVTGKVTDENGEPLAGVNVVLRGTLTGDATNLDGNFTVKLGQRASAVLDFSYIGFASESRTVTSGTKNLLVVMKEDASLNEAVVQGYGRVQKKENLVGSVYQVNSKDLENKPLTRVENLLEGMVPGLIIQPNNDSPTSVRTRYQVRIRGDASLSASNEPLWLVDGVPIYTGDGTNMVAGMQYTVPPLSMINPLDIESITVLKDASAVSIYGADGSNGVILITTKSGKFGDSPTSVTANLRYGVTHIDRSTMIRLMNAEEYMAYAKEAWVNGGNDPALFPYQDNEHNSYSTTDTDWTDEYFRLGQTMNANVSLRSSSKVSSSYFSAGYYSENSTVDGNDQQRFSARINNSYKIGSRLTFRPQISASYNINKIFSPSRDYYENLPIFSPYDPDGYTLRLYNKVVSGKDASGNLTWLNRKFFSNSISERELDDNTQKSFLTDGNFLLTGVIIDALKATVQFGMSYTHNYETLYDSMYTLGGMDGTEPRGSSVRCSSHTLNWNNVERLNYDRTFGKHHVSGLLGIELKSAAYRTLYGSGSGFMSDKEQEVSFSETDSRNAQSSRSQTRQLSYMGQAAYTYDGRYTLQTNFRRQGASSFGKYAKWENYFSVGGSWNISKEAFWKVGWLDNMKLKFSYGTSGNSRVDSALMKGLGTFSYGDSFSYNGSIGGVVAMPANPGLSWEKTYMSNIGLDFRLLERFDFGIEAYYNYTKDLLSKIYTSSMIGDNRIYANIGEMSNKGLEFTFTSTNIDHEHFRWMTDFNISHNINRVEKLADGNPISYSTSIVAEGHDVNTWYLVKWAGVDPSTGAPMWYDIDGNLTYTYSAADRRMEKSATPKAYGGMLNSFQFGPFSVSLQLNYSIGGYALCYLASTSETDGYSVIDQNESVNQKDHWRKPGDVSSNPRISTVSSASTRSSTRYLYDKTNVQLKNLTLSYDLPQRLVKKIAMKSCRASVIVDNLYLWTPDQDPDRNTYKQYMNGFPVERTFTFSLDMNF